MPTDPAGSGAGEVHRPPADATVAVIIPARNESRTIEGCIERVLCGSIQPDEILVIDGRSTDDTRAVVSAVAQRDQRVRLLDNPAKTIPSALNIGWRASTCDVIVRVDAHTEISHEYLMLAREHLATGEWSGVGGRKQPVAATAFGRAVAAAMSSRWGVGNSRYHYASGCEEAEHVPFGAYPRSVIEKLGGWDETVLVNEDFEFDYRLRSHGGRLLFDASMWSYWACSNTVRDLAYQYHRYGKGKAIVARKHPASLRLRHLAPPVVVAGLMGAVVGGSVLLMPVAWGGIGAYLLGIASSAVVGKGRTLPLGERVRFPLAVFVMHNAWGVGFIQGLLKVLRGRRDLDSFKSRRLSLDAAASAGDEASQA